MNEPWRARPTKIPGLDIIDPITLQDRPVPERKWIVPGLVPHDDVTLLAGDGGKGKSLLILMLMVAAALGRDWLRRHVMPCKTFGVFCEDSKAEIHRRLVPILAHFEADFADLENMQYVCRRGQENALMIFPSLYEPGETTKLHADVMNHALDFGAQLVVLDSLHDFFPGDENRRTQARQFIAELNTIAREIDGAVVMSAHPSVAGRNSGTGESGSTAWNNACRSRLFLTQPTENGDARATRDIRVLRSMKANYSAAGGEITMKWENGVFVAEPDDEGVITSIKKHRAETAFIDALDALTGQGRTASEHRNASNFAPKILAQMPEANGCTARHLATAMDALFAQGRIVVGLTKIVGGDRKPKRGIMRADQQQEKLI